MFTKGKWWVEVHDNDTSIESEHQTIGSDVSNEDADHIVDMHNKQEAFEAMEKALKMVLRLFEGEELDKKFDGETEVIREALKLARGE